MPPWLFQKLCSGALGFKMYPQGECSVVPADSRKPEVILSHARILRVPQLRARRHKFPP